MKCIIYKQLQCQWPFLYLNYEMYHIQVVTMLVALIQSIRLCDEVIYNYLPTFNQHRKKNHSRKFPECKCCQIYKMFSSDIMPQTMEYFTPCYNRWYYMLKDIIRVIWFFNWTVTFTPWYNSWYYMRKRHKWLILNESYMRVFEYWQSCS